MPRSSCPPGQILRSSYTRRRRSNSKERRVSKTRVPATCVKDTGRRGKTPPSQRVLPTLKPGRLGKYGYSTHKGAETRRRALTKAIKTEGYATIVRRVVAASNYISRTAPVAHAKMRADLKWVKKHLAPEYSLTARRRRSRKNRSSRNSLRRRSRSHRRRSGRRRSKSRRRSSRR